MKLSIITINFNNCTGLKKTIESVVEQSFKDFEWIVIDGGSTDGSRELIEQYADRFTYWVSEPDKGIYNAMNKGIKVAKGDYLQFLNSGDWLCDSMALERFFAYSFNADVVYGDYYFSGKGNELIECKQPEIMTFRVFLYSALGHNACFFKNALFQDELYDEGLRIVSDWKFCINQSLANKSFQHIDEFVSCFDTTGISSVNKELAKSERGMVVKELVPRMILADYQTMDEMENKLDNILVREVMKYSEKSVSYKKLLSFVLRIIRFTDKRLCKNREER